MAGNAALGEVSASRAGRAGTSGSVSDDASTRRAPGVVRAFSQSDDASLRALLRATVIPGNVRVAFTREPSYLAGERVAGCEDATVVAPQNGRVVGVGRCSIHQLFRNGAPQRVGYLGELRVAPGTAAGARRLREGYAALAGQMHGRAVDAYFTSITSDNERARRVLEHGGRLGLPRYMPLARLVTLVASVGRGRKAIAETSMARAEVDRSTLLSFLESLARTAHLSLAWSADRLSSLASHGVSPEDFVTIVRGGKVVAAGAVWDQRRFRQVVVDGYEGALRLTRPIVNVALRLGGQPPLPPPGSVLAQGAALGAMVAEPGDWPSLWPALAARARARGLSWITIARDARDPELPVLRSLLRAREYHTTLYDVMLEGVPARPQWDDRLVRPEVGLL